MIWLTWRQHRHQLLFGVLGLAALAGFLVPTGLEMRQLFADSGLADCLNTTAGDCGSLASQFGSRYETFGYLSVAFLVLPLLAGIFWGAPLMAREIEHGTHRMIWTQGITRLRWATVKIGLITLAVLVLATIYALLITWWQGPLLRVSGYGFDLLFFDGHGIVIVGYTLFAVALGILAGTLTHRMLPAMAITLVGFLAVRILVALLARTNFLPPVQLRHSTANWPQDVLDGGYIVDRGTYTASGEVVSDSGIMTCPPPGSPFYIQECGSDGSYNVVHYQPADRFWLFQGIETALFAVLAVAMVLTAVHWIRRRIA